MSDERLQLHIADWMRQLALPSTIELRCKDEIIDSVIVSDGCAFDTLAADLLEAATVDAADEGKTRVYMLIGIGENRERYPCPLRIRRRIDKSAGDLIAVLAKQNAELHECLRKKDKEASDLLLKYAQTVGADRAKLVEENAHHRAHTSEVLTKLEALRSEQLERDMILTKHTAELEMKERLTDAVVPLALAIGSKLTGGMLPARDMNATLFVEIVKSLNETQLDAIRGVLGNNWPSFESLFSAALDGQPDVKRFRALAAELSEEKVMAVAQTLNVGQQAALQELLNADN